MVCAVIKFLAGPGDSDGMPHLRLASALLYRGYTTSMSIYTMPLMGGEIIVKPPFSSHATFVEDCNSNKNPSKTVNSSRKELRCTKSRN